jgi:hypothetical protein
MITLRLPAHGEVEVELPFFAADQESTWSSTIVALPMTPERSPYVDGTTCNVRVASAVALRYNVSRNPATKMS